jgi:tetratricopeptide (TPR) repeat protein
MKKTRLFILAVFAIFVALVLVWMNVFQSKKATINEVTEVIKTYPFSDPDPVPILTRSSMWGRGARLYPYFFFDKFSQTSVDKEWNVVRMENPYIEVSILPQVGGKIRGASEKSTGKEFIYTNHVLKFREIALRGAWTSGGIEFNFGIVGHAPSCATPVDYILRENKDGSVSCVVGTMDLPSRTRWSVTVTLPRDKAFFETHTLWYNPSPLHQSYYSWMNAAVKAGNDLQYVFPGRFHIGHNYSVPLESWPVNRKGRDLSLYKNNDFGGSKSYFTVGEYENFYGGYWHDSKFGFGHWALYDDLPGQKVWIWSLSQQGGIWEELLTDSDGQYSEPQSGRLLNQSDHAFFMPYTGDVWREIWFPYKEIGPMVQASPYGTMNVTRTGDSITVGICPLQDIDDDLVVFVEGKEVFRESLRLAPMEVYVKTLPIELKEGVLQVNVSKKLCYSSDPEANDLKRPLHFQRNEGSTIEGLYQSAELYDKERNYYRALEKYLACLKRDPDHTKALSRVAELYFRRGEYKKALAHARRVLKNVMYDPEANYIYGVISRRLGNLVDAKEALGWAARSMEYRSGAYCQMAEIYFQEEHFELALEYARRALDFNTYNMNAYQVLAITYRKIKKPEDAHTVLKQILEIDPLNHQARFEFYLLKPGKKNLEYFKEMIRNELPHENYLEMAISYEKLGLTADAVELLKHAPDYSTVHYWLAYLLKESAPEQSREYLNKAQNLSPRLVFPFREESIPVFRWASDRLPSGWKAKYFLGLILWSKGRLEEARNLLIDCGTPDFAPFYLARGHLFKEINPEKTLSDFEEALKVDRKSWKVLHHLITYYSELGMFDKSLALAREAVSTLPDEGVVRMDLVRSLIKNRLYREALDILEGTEALPSEGATGIHALFVSCQIELALKGMKEANYSQALQYLEGSKRYPESLGTGKPYDPDFRMQDYLIALCYDKTGEKNKAEERRKAIYDYTLKFWTEKRRYLYFGGLILQYFGEHKKAKQLLIETKPSKKVLDIIKILSR